MKKIKEYFPITEEDALRILKENEGKPVGGFAFRNSFHDKWAECELTAVYYPLDFPFVRRGGSTFEYCARVSERYPNEIPSDIVALPEPYLAYLQMGPLPEDKRLIGEEREDSPLWVVFAGHWNDGDDVPYGGNGTQHYALDVRTAYAKRVWPEIVEAMEYQEPPCWKVGDTVEVTEDEVCQNVTYFKAGAKGIVTEVSPDLVWVRQTSPDPYGDGNWLVKKTNLKPWVPDYGYLLTGEVAPVAPKGWRILDKDEGIPQDAQTMGCTKRGEWKEFSNRFIASVAASIGSYRAIAVKEPLEEGSELLPCPFCGSVNIKIKNNGIGDFYAICEDLYDLGCGAKTSDINAESHAIAMERWNKRK